jgi:hypothetical protein
MVKHANRLCVAVLTATNGQNRKAGLGGSRSSVGSGIATGVSAQSRVPGRLLDKDDEPVEGR